jgi:hypothetical protein
LTPSSREVFPFGNLSSSCSASSFRRQDKEANPVLRVEEVKKRTFSSNFQNEDDEKESQRNKRQSENKGEGLSTALDLFSRPSLLNVFECHKLFIASFTHSLTQEGHEKLTRKMFTSPVLCWSCNVNLSYLSSSQTCRRRQNRFMASGIEK